jgi:Bacterial regulatory proteins, tetR family.
MSREPSIDPRYLRVRAALVDALLLLAAETPAEDIGVRDLTSAAGVSRQAFYGHAPSPASLLAETLINELGPVVDGLVESLHDEDARFERVWRDAYRAVLDHVAHHVDIYRVMVSSHSAVFNAVVGAFEGPARVFVDTVAQALETDTPGRLWREMAVQQQVANLGAVIRAWLSTGLEDPPEEVVDTYMTLAPPWQLARRDSHGHISMRRARSLRAAPDSGAS